MIDYRSFMCTPEEDRIFEDLARLPYPNFYYALEDLVASHAPKVTYSIHRPSSQRVLEECVQRAAEHCGLRCNLPGRGAEVSFPSTHHTWEHFCDASDARVLAEQHIWAAVTAQPKNEAFNCSNGDVFMSNVLSQVFDVEFVPFDEKDEFDLVEMMKDKGKVWN
ncbi:hypothetical protein L484_007741 [Morus notabilis]|uniref:Uncharacterized protein n=1 Tax=Morus notabilis TaxID=981085 RepID=W9QW75_9ROSA|nr:hypothetical protein L484_007741 [Morus notabilis]